jgi:serine/threonine protein kinase
MPSSKQVGAQLSDPCPCCCGLQVGTLSHMAPEVLQEGRLSTAADVYSFGVLSEWLVV